VTTVTAVIVSFGAQPWIERCVDAVLASTGVDVDVVIVDNGDTSGAIKKLAGRCRVGVLSPGRNTGFAAGCNAGVAAASGEVVALINPDVIVEPDALASLAAVASEPVVGLATSSVRLADAPALMNSAGNPVHYLGLAWAGGHGETADRYDKRRTVASASGACCAMRRSLWMSLGGFETAYFAYHEDVEMSLRCWQRGLEVVYVPDAVAVHHYEFARNKLKSELLERNRWLTLLTVYSSRTLWLLAPALAGMELAVLADAAVRGWLPAKVAGYRWLLRNRALVSRRRAQLQAERSRPDRDLVPVLAARFEPTNVDAPPGLPMLNAVLAAYWAVVRRFV
jgi:GT2 family glycosyltransferase